MSFSWFVARRYLTARRRQAFISLISFVSILGVGLGVMALIIGLALMTGVQTELKDRIVGATAHVYVYKDLGPPFGDFETMRKRLTLPGVVGVAPALIDPVLLTTGSISQPATLKGVDPARELEVTDIGRAMLSGSLDALAQRPSEAHDGVVLGSDLARQMGLKMGDEVNVVTASLTTGLLGRMQHQRPLTVVGTFQTGFYDLDRNYALVTMQTASQLFDRDTDLMQIRLANMDDAVAVRQELQAQLGQTYSVKDWTQLNGTLYTALTLEKLAVSLTIGLIILVAALNIVASLVLLVMEKTRDIAILRTMGTPARTIRRIFVYQGLAIGLIGTLSGTILGIVVSKIADHYQLIKLPGDTYQISYLPFRVLPLDVLIVVVGAIGVCLAATVYPSRQAGRIDPAEALRNS